MASALGLWSRRVDETELVERLHLPRAERIMDELLTALAGQTWRSGEAAHDPPRSTLYPEPKNTSEYSR